MQTHKDLTAKHIILLTLILSIYYTASGQEKLDAKFSAYDGDVTEYLRDGFFKEFREIFNPDGDFVYSLTLDILIDEDGNVGNVGLIEKSTNDKFDSYLLRKISETSCMWEIKGNNTQSSTYHIIVPYRLKIFPQYSKIDVEEREIKSDKYKRQHENLTIDDLAGYDKSSTIILNEVLHAVSEIWTSSHAESIRETYPRPLR